MMMNRDDYEKMLEQITPELVQKLIGAPGETSEIKVGLFIHSFLVQAVKYGYLSETEAIGLLEMSKSLFVDDLTTL